MQTNPRLKKLKLRKDQIEARIRNLEARDKAREKKRDTRRKILIGAFYMEQMEKDEMLKKKILSGLNGFLVRENDRELFGLGEKRPVEKADTPPKLPEKRKTA
jgi:large subunit ribosomal protein L7/L12